MRTSTLHIKVTAEMAERLKALSRRLETPVGELIRQAVISRYQLELLDLPERQRHAVEAFRGGYISLGKLAEKMGMDVWGLREWLRDHEIPQNNSFLESDIENA